MAHMKASPTGTLVAGLRHLRAEWGRWWSAEDVSDTYVAHHVLNDQYRLWRSNIMRTKGEVRQNIQLMRRQQRQQQTMQMQRMAAMRQTARARGGGRGHGVMGGSSPMIAYRTMQWAELDIKMGQREFEPTGVTPNMLAVGRAQLRARRHRVAAVWMLVLFVLWLGAWALSAVAALLVAAIAAVVYLGGAWSAGRNPRRRRPVPPKLLFVPAKEFAGAEVEPEPEPFPLREAGRTPKVAREAVRLALLREGLDVEEVGLPEDTGWGWRVSVTLSSGTLAGLARVLKQVATTLRVGSSRLLARAADAEDASRITLQILTDDPFAHPLPYPERPPLGCSIRRPVSIGLSLDGQTTPVVLGGQHVLVVGKTGSGKTSMVTALAEYATACEDAVVVDIDVVKRGLRGFAQAAAATARTTGDAEDVLAWLLQLATDRIASLPDDIEVWTPTPDAPAVLIFIDELQALSDRGKELTLKILEIGREARVTLVLSTPNALRDTVGQSVAETFGVRIMMGCRSADIPLVVGQPDAMTQGWLPHLLIPSPAEDDPADAGRFYAITPHHREPILRYVSHLPAGEVVRRAQERIAAGLPQLTTPTAPQPDESAHVSAVGKLLLDAFAAAGDPEVLPVAAFGDYLVQHDPGTWGQWEEHSRRNMMLGKQIQEALRAAALEIPTERARGKVPGYGDRPKVYRLKVVREALS